MSQTLSGKIASDITNDEGIFIFDINTKGSRISGVKRRLSLSKE
jgi:hypothetical protein